MDDFELTAYNPSLKHEWDSFVDSSKNGTFLFRRDYMDYHADRFPDHSLIVTRKGNIYALLPASPLGDSIYSHPGLTYGGLILNRKATAARCIAVMSAVCALFASQGYRTLHYRPVPHIYHRMAAEEDLYALFSLGAVLERRMAASVVCQTDRAIFHANRRKGIRKAAAAGISISESDDFASFWKILEENLHSRYNAVPVHSLLEISRLASCFPNNIRLFTAHKDSSIVAGTVIYLSGDVAHTQYISANPEGKATGALDLLFKTLLDDVFIGCRYFDFGTSNLKADSILNESLIRQKEGFGGRTICYDSYKIDISGLISTKNTDYT